MYDMGYDAYRQTEVNVKAASASPAELVLMLMNGLLDEIDRAEGHILAKNFNKKGESIKKSMRILSGLTVALDPEQGGALAQNLKQLYQYCGRKLTRASIRNNLDDLAEVRKILRELQEGWQGFARRNS